MKRRGWVDALFIFPCALAFVMVIIFPFFIGIYYSMTDWDGVNPIISWVGFSNFSGMFSQPQFLYSFMITLLYTAINIVFVNVVGFLLSLLATSKARLRNLYRAGFFVPNLIGGIVLGYIWQFLFNNVFIDIGQAMGIGFLSSSLISKPGTVILGYVVCQHLAVCRVYYDDLRRGDPIDLRQHHGGGQLWMAPPTSSASGRS